MDSIPLQTQLYKDSFDPPTSAFVNIQASIIGPDQADIVLGTVPESSTVLAFALGLGFLIRKRLSQLNMLLQK